MILSLISGKGGVGKTTTAVSLAAALAEKGNEVILVDGNLTTPNVSLHLGIPLYPVTLHDVLRGDARIDEALYTHKSGIRIVPASLSVEDLKDLKPEKFQNLINDLLRYSGLILIDGAAGLGKEARAAIRVSDGVIIVTNPELPAVTDALKAIKLAHKYRRPVIGAVINKIKNAKHEMSKEEISSILEVPIMGEIAEDNKVKEAIHKKTPVIHHSPRARASKDFRRLASNLLGEEVQEKRGLFDMLFGWIR